MKIQKNSKNSHKRTYILITLALLLLIGGGASYALLQRNTSQQQDGTSSVNLNEASDDEKKAGQVAKEKSANSNEATNKDIQTDIPPAPVPQASGKSIVQVDITAANQNDSTVQIRSAIGVVTDTGTCTIRAVRGDTIYTKTSSIQALANTSTCQGFDIPVSELGKGSWDISLRFENDTLTGTASRQINVK